MKKYFFWIGLICIFYLYSNEEAIPKVAILTCSDLMASPAQIFSASIEDFFIVRSSGSVLDDVNRASLEFGIEIFNIPTLIILTHNNCRAIQGVIETVFKHVPANPKSMSAVYSKIEPSLKFLVDEKITDESFDQASKKNALYQLKMLTKTSKIVSQKLRKKTLQAKAVFFNEETKKIEYLNE